SRTGKAPEEFAPALTVTVRDAQGQPYVLSAGRLAGAGAVRTQTVDLVPEGRDVPRGRLWLSGLRVSGELPPGLDARVRLGVERVGALTGTGGGAGRAVAVPEGLRWQGTSTPVVELTPGRAVPLRPEAAAGRPLSVTTHLSAPRASWASSGTGVNLDVWAGAAEVPATVPALASDAFLTAAHAKRGQTLTVPVEGTEVRVEVVDTVAHVPTTGEEAATATDASGQDSGSPSGRGGDGGGRRGRRRRGRRPARGSADAERGARGGGRDTARPDRVVAEHGRGAFRRGGRAVAGAPRQRPGGCARTGRGAADADR
ncbi:hypothetical protein GA0115246_111362, partial [Streptomyces sp. SolWspMP-sol7th]